MAIKTKPFDAAEHLSTPERIAAYMNVILEDGEADEIAEAVATVSRARRMHHLEDAASGTAPTSLAPTDIDAVRRGLNALGLRLQVAAA